MNIKYQVNGKTVLADPFMQILSNEESEKTDGSDILMKRPPHKTVLSVNQSIADMDQVAPEILEMFRKLREESAKAPSRAAAAQAAVLRLAKASYGHDNHQALIIRAWLLNLFHGTAHGTETVDLTDIQILDFNLRSDLLAVLWAFNGPSFPDTAIRDAFVAAGDKDLDWFIAPLRTVMK